MVAPEGALIGEMLSETSIGVPSFRSRTVSSRSILSPQPMRRRDVLHFRQPIVGYEECDILTGRFRRGVPEQVLGGRIPARYRAVKGHRNNGIA